MADPDFLRKRTETLLRITQASYKTSHLISLTSGNSGVGSLKVDKRTFDWLIDAWSYSGEDDAADNALSLLYRMEELRDGGAGDATADVGAGCHPAAGAVSPDVKSYTQVIGAIAHSGRPDAGEMAEKVLKRMTAAASSSSSRPCDDSACDVRPNTLTYTYVADAYARSSSPRAPHAAQRIVEEMERLRAGGDPEVRPTSRAWNSVISAWAQWEGEEMVSEISLCSVARPPFFMNIIYRICLEFVTSSNLHTRVNIFMPRAACSSDTQHPKGMGTHWVWGRARRGMLGHHGGVGEYYRERGRPTELFQLQ